MSEKGRKSGHLLKSIYPSLSGSDSSDSSSNHIKDDHKCEKGVEDEEKA